MLNTNKLFRPTIIFETHYWRYQKDPSFYNHLKELFSRGYKAKYISSSDEKGSKIIEEKKYLSIKKLTTDGVVRKIFENIEWKKYTHNMGAENIGGKSNLIRAYEETKRDHVK